MKNTQSPLKRKLSVLAMAAALVSPSRLRSAVAIVALFCGFVHTATAAPATLVQSVTYNGETITMRLNKEDLRGANFELWSQNAAGGYDVITPVDERSYIGSVDGYPDAVSCGVLLDDGITFKGAVYFDRGVTWFTIGNAVNYTRAEDYGTFSHFQLSSTPTVGAGQAGSTMYAYELAVDVDHNYFTSRNSSVASAFETIEYSVCVVRAIYMRDALLRPYLGRVIVRSTLAHDPYTGLTQGGYLGALRTEWKTNQSDVNPALVAGASPTKIGGGLAWVGQVGADLKYSVSQSGSGEFNVVFRHEMGHNWGCGHYVGGSPEGTGLMGGNQAGRFSGPELYRVFGHRDSRIATGGILDNVGTYTTVELPPYASLDTVEFEVGSVSLPIDVLANDHDSNGQALTIIRHDSSSASGGTITQQGNNLVYTPVNGAFLGLDSFSYTITDTSGKTATGITLVNVIPAPTPLVLHLPLDETSGLTAVDQTAFLNHGSLYAIDGVNFSTNSTAGKYENALNFNGQFLRVQVPSFTLTANTITLSAWIKPNGNQAPWAGIIMDNTAQKSGLGFGTAGELRYQWDGAYSNWNSGLVPPVGSWTFVTLVIEPTSATIYMDSGSGFQSATNNTSHAPSEFKSPFIGWSPGDFLSKYFTGAIDDVRIYDQAMTESQLRGVYSGGAIESPSPFDGAWGVAQTDLTWASAIGTFQYHVYLGTDRDAVLNATPASSEFLGAVGSPRYANPTLDPKTTYYWRVDTQRPSEILKGAVWKFTRGPSEELVITNHSFEDGAATGGVPTGWSLTSGSDLGVGSGGSDGSQFLFVALGTTITQDLNHTVATGETLTLQFESDRAYSRNIQLLAKTGGSYTLLAESTVTTGDSGWPTIKLDHTVAAAYNGQQLALRIISDPSEWNQFDNFRITSSGTPSAPPSWNSGTIAKTAAVEDLAYSGSLSTDASDPESAPLTFTKISGPEWLQIAEDGTLSGTPHFADIGAQSWQVSVTDLFTTPVVATLTTTVKIDADNDSIPDDWETANGLNPNVDDRTLDADRDGFDNWFEYMADTDPGSRGSQQTFTVDTAPSDPTLRFSTSPNRHYTVYYSEDLSENSWKALKSAVPGTGTEMTISDSTPITKKRFYRLQIKLP